MDLHVAKGVFITFPARVNLSQSVRYSGGLFVFSLKHFYSGCVLCRVSTALTPAGRTSKLQSNTAIERKPVWQKTFFPLGGD